jgi:5-methylcytosine-specific restriction endonuclease McrA
MKNKHLYSPDWLDVIRPTILKRDNYKCQSCGVKHKAWYEKHNVKAGNELDEHERNYFKRIGIFLRQIHLQVCHIDQNPANNDYSNLIAKCPKCHLTMDNSFNNLKKSSKKFLSNLNHSLINLGFTLLIIGLS